MTTTTTAFAADEETARRYAVAQIQKAHAAEIDEQRRQEERVVAVRGGDTFTAQDAENGYVPHDAVWVGGDGKRR